MDTIIMTPDEIATLHPEPFHDMTHEGQPYRVLLRQGRALEWREGAWEPLRNMDLHADILRALNDGYGPNGD